jgi:hypothetical protein
MKVEHVTTNKKLLPRTWWNSEAARTRDLTHIKEVLDRQETAWNAMISMWEETGDPEVPSRSPKSRVTRAGEKVQRFP